MFGVDGAQRERIDGFVATAKALFFRSQLIGRLTPNLYQSTMLPAAGRGPRDHPRHRRRASSRRSAAWCCCSCARARTASRCRAPTRRCASRCRSSNACRKPRVATTRARPCDGDEPLRARATRSPSRRLLRLHARLARCCRTSASRSPAGRPWASSAPRARASRRSCSSLLQLRDAERRALSRQRTRPPSRSAATTGTGSSPTCPRSRACCTPRWPRTSATSATSTMRASNARRSLARIHDDIMAGRTATRPSSARAPTPSPAGQQQRICLARALAARPEVLVLDEPTSALDPHSERLIQESLTALKHELTLFIIAHRMSTLDICDRVMVIIDGRLVGVRHARAARAGQPVLPLRLDARRRAGALPAGQVVAPVESAATRAAAVALPTSSSSGTPRAAPRRCTRCSRRHPQIYMPRGKEPWFFADRAARAHPAATGRDRRARSQEYVALFAGATPEQRVGEASALYLWSRTAAARIAQARPDARIIAILREPASFLRSLHLQFLQTLHRDGARPRAGRSRSSPRAVRAARYPATPTGRRRCSTPSTSATWSSCAATTRCSRASRCWC